MLISCNNPIDNAISINMNISNVAIIMTAIIRIATIVCFMG